MGHWERSRENWILLKEYLSEEEKEIRANKEVRIASTMDPWFVDRDLDSVVGGLDPGDVMSQFIESLLSFVLNSNLVRWNTIWE